MCVYMRTILFLCLCVYIWALSVMCVYMRTIISMCMLVYVAFLIYNFARAVAIPVCSLRFSTARNSNVLDMHTDMWVYLPCLRRLSPAGRAVAKRSIHYPGLGGVVPLRQSCSPLPQSCVTLHFLYHVISVHITFYVTFSTTFNCISYYILCSIYFNVLFHFTLHSVLHFTSTFNFSS